MTCPRTYNPRGQRIQSTFSITAVVLETCIILFILSGNSCCADEDDVRRLKQDKSDLTLQIKFSQNVSELRAIGTVQ